MARARDQFRATDVSFWGAFALCCWGIAILGANLAGLVPPGVLGGLHASRLEGGTMNQLRAQVASLTTQSANLTAANEALASRFSIAEQQGGLAAQRIGALEVALPNLVESRNGSGVDSAAVTASIGEAPQMSPDGTVSVAQKAMPPDPTAQPMPATVLAPRPDGDAFGIALGGPVDAYGASAAWQGITAKVGTLLIGLAPLLADQADASGKRIVAGPLPGFSAALDLCARMAQVGITCRPVPFVGDPLVP